LKQGDEIVHWSASRRVNDLHTTSSLPDSKLVWSGNDTSQEATESLRHRSS